MRQREFCSHCRIIPQRGFTMIELMVALILFCGLTIAMFATMKALRESSQRAAIGTRELASAIRFAERFRADVRQAAHVQVKDNGRGVALHYAVSALRRGALTTAGKKAEPFPRVVTYQRGPRGRMERLIEAGERQTGPRVESVRFWTDHWLSDRGKRTILRARLVCCDETETDPVRRPGLASLHAVVLDTRLRSPRPANRQPTTLGSWLTAREESTVVPRALEATRREIRE